MTKRVVVTGLGVLSPLGNSAEEAWDNAKNGKSGIDWIHDIDPGTGCVEVAGAVKNFDAEEVFGRREARRMDRVTQFALAAAKQALEDSGLEVTEENAYDIACIMGTGIGSIRILSDAVIGFEHKQARGVSPTMVPALLSDNIGGKISIELGLKGANYCIITACATGNNAIGDATDMIRLGRAKAVVAGASEAAFVGPVMSGFNNIKALTQYDGDDPTKASRPFNKNRDGFVAADGAAVLILEELEHALARGARIYGEIKGYGHTSDAFHVTAPDPNGESAAMAMKLAMQDANLTVDDINYINAHGTGTPLNDSAETMAIKKALGEQAYNIPVSSTKSMTGHMLSATAALEAIFGLMAIRDNYVPPTINLDEIDPECDLDYVPNEGRAHTVNNVMSNAFGFGGHNAVIIVGRYDA